MGDLQFRPDVPNARVLLTLKIRLSKNQKFQTGRTCQYLKIMLYLPSRALYVKSVEQNTITGPRVIFLATMQTDGRVVIFARNITNNGTIQLPQT